MGWDLRTCICNNISGAIAGHSLGTTIYKPLIHPPPRAGSGMGLPWNGTGFNFMLFIQIVQIKNLCFCWTCSFQHIGMLAGAYGYEKEEVCQEKKEMQRKAMQRVEDKDYS